MSTYDHRTPAPAREGPLARVAMASYLLPGLAHIWPRLRRELGVEHRTASGAGYALTFDDGPHPQGTPAVLEVLAAAGVRATFFLVGEQLRRNPALGAEIVAAGHTVALHCDRHRNLLRLAPRQVRADLDRAQATIEDLTGRSPVLYPPRAGGAGARCGGATGGATGRPARPPPRSPRTSRLAPPTGRCCCCTTPTTTAPPDRGGGPPPRGRG